MRVIIVSAMVAGLLAAQAHASAYSDFNKAISARNDGNSDESVRLLSLVLSEPGLSDGLRPTAFLMRAEAYVDLKKLDLALADFSGSLRLNPDNYIAFVERGDLYFRREELDLAREDYIAACKLRPEQWRPYANLGQLSVRQGKLDDALKYYDMGLEAMPDVLDFHVLRSQAYRLQGQYEKASDEAELAIGRNRRYAEAYLARAQVEDDSGSTEAAMADFDRAHDMDSSDLKISLYRGIAQWMRGRYVDAAESFRGGTEAYMLIWRFLANAKLAGNGAKSSEDAKKFSETVWPAPIVQMIAGTVQPGAVLAVATNSVGYDRIAKTCEADFYVGEWQVLHGQTAAGKALMDHAANECPLGFAERSGARVEMGRLP